MAPILILRYLLLAKREEADALRRFPEEYRAYMARVPAWIPRMQ